MYLALQSPPDLILSHEKFQSPLPHCWNFLAHLPKFITDCCT